MKNAINVDLNDEKLTAAERRILREATDGATSNRVATPEHLSHAAQLGRDGFAAGLPAAPAANKSLMTFLTSKTLQIGEWIQLMDAYARAWTKANLEAPVPGWSDEENAALVRARSGT